MAEAISAFRKRPFYELYALSRKRLFYAFYALFEQNLLHVSCILFTAFTAYQRPAALTIRRFYSMPPIQSASGHIRIGINIAGV